MRTTNSLGVTPTTATPSAQLSEGLECRSLGRRFATTVLGAAALSLLGLVPAHAVSVLPRSTPLAALSEMGLGQPDALQNSIMPAAPSPIAASPFLSGELSLAPLTLPDVTVPGLESLSSISSESVLGLSLAMLTLKLSDTDTPPGLESDLPENSVAALKVVDLRLGEATPYVDLTLDLESVPEFARPGYEAVGGSVYEELMDETEAKLTAQADPEMVASNPLALVPQNPLPNSVPIPVPAVESSTLPKAPVTRSQTVSVGRADQRQRLSNTVTLPRTLPGMTPQTVAVATPTTRTAAITPAPAATNAITTPAPVSLIARQSTAPNLPSIELPPLPPSDRYLPNSITTQFIWPARGVFTSGFGPRWGRMHRGIDIAAPVGTPVVAAASGVVTYAAWNSGGFGNLVEIRHSDGTLTLYAHNNRIRVREGQYVQQGELVADMGSTGRSTGPHVHFEIRPLGRGAVNPMLFLTRG